MPSAQRYSCLPASDTNRYATLPPATSCLRPQPRSHATLRNCVASFARREPFSELLRQFSPLAQWWRFQAGLFGSATAAMVKRLDASIFFFDPQLSVSTFSVLALKVYR